MHIRSASDFVMLSMLVSKDEVLGAKSFGGHSFWQLVLGNGTLRGGTVRNVLICITLPGNWPIGTNWLMLIHR